MRVEHDGAVPPQVIPLAAEASHGPVVRGATQEGAASGRLMQASAASPKAHVFA